MKAVRFIKAGMGVWFIHPEAKVAAIMGVRFAGAQPYDAQLPSVSQWFFGVLAARRNVGHAYIFVSCTFAACAFCLPPALPSCLSGVQLILQLSPWRARNSTSLAAAFSASVRTPE
jgi:hypothetical protein